MSRQANFSTQQLAPSYQTSLIYEEAKLGSKSFVAQHIFSLEIVGAEEEGALLQECVAGACCGSKLPHVYQPLRNLSNEQCFFLPC